MEHPSDVPYEPPGESPEGDAPPPGPAVERRADETAVGPTDTDVDQEPPGADRRRRATRAALEWIVLIACALVIALVVKTFLFQAFYIPSDSMVPTLKTNDRVIVNKLSYHLHPVHRGDIVVFKTPKGPNGAPIDPSIKDLVKRVIGLPGETVGTRNGHVTVDGKVLNEPYLPAGTVSNCDAFQANCFPSGPLPADRYFVMGDNRAQSRDSRYFGAIAKSEIVGRVFVRVWPLNRLHIF